jgi:hypothetical protein
MTCPESYQALAEHINHSFDPSSFQCEIKVPDGYEVAHDEFTLKITLHVCPHKKDMNLTIDLKVTHTLVALALIECLLDFCREHEFSPFAQEVDFLTAAAWRSYDFIPNPYRPGEYRPRSFRLSECHAHS